MASKAQDEAKDALLAAITSMAAAGAATGGTAGSAMVRDAAYAWRAVVGGYQPGGVAGS